MKPHSQNKELKFLNTIFSVLVLSGCFGACDTVRKSYHETDFQMKHIGIIAKAESALYNDVLLLQLSFKNQTETPFIIYKPEFELNRHTGLYYFGYLKDSIPTEFVFCSNKSDSFNLMNIKQVTLDERNSIFLNSRESIFVNIVIPRKNICISDTSFINKPLLFRIFYESVNFIVNESLNEQTERLKKVFVFNGNITILNNPIIKSVNQSYY